MMAAGYVFATNKLTKLVDMFYQAGLRNGGMVPACYISGLPGAGKTWLAECFGKALNANVIFYQCTAATDSTTLIGDINPAAVIQGRGEQIVTNGALLKLANADVPSVLILDEWDKGGPELDAFLLDILQSRRVRNYNGEMVPLPDSNVWVFLTSNGDRPISDALARRVRKWELEKLSGVEVASILGLDPKHDLIRLWECLPSLALSQLQSYIDDFGGADMVPDGIDVDVMGQYVDLSGIELEHLGSEGEENECDDSKPEIFSCTGFDVHVETDWDMYSIASKYIPDSMWDVNSVTYTIKSEADWKKAKDAIAVARKGGVNNITVELHKDYLPRGAEVILPTSVVASANDIIEEDDKVLVIDKDHKCRPHVGRRVLGGLVALKVLDIDDATQLIGGLL